MQSSVPKRNTGKCLLTVGIFNASWNILFFLFQNCEPRCRMCAKILATISERRRTDNSVLGFWLLKLAQTPNVAMHSATVLLNFVLYFGFFFGGGGDFFFFFFFFFLQYSTLQYSTTVQYSTVQYSTVQYSTVQYSTVQYSTVQYSTVQYSTVHSTIVSGRWNQVLVSGRWQIWWCEGEGEGEGGEEKVHLLTHTTTRGMGKNVMEKKKEKEWRMRTPFFV